MLQAHGGSEVFRGSWYFIQFSSLLKMFGRLPPDPPLYVPVHCELLPEAGEVQGGGAGGGAETTTSAVAARRSGQ